MKILEIFIALSLFNMLLYYYLKHRRDREDYHRSLDEMEKQEAQDEDGEEQQP